MNKEEIKLLKLPAELTVTKADDVINNIAQQVDEGWLNPLALLGQITFIEKVIKGVKAHIAPATLKEAEKYGKSFGAHGVQFQIKEMGVKYDYSDDEEWKVMQENIDALRAEQIGREATLKAAKLCARTSTTSVICTLNK